MKKNRIGFLLACSLVVACGGDGDGDGAGPAESTARVQSMSLVLGAAFDSLAFVGNSQVLTSLENAIPGSTTTVPAAFLTNHEETDPAAEIEEFLTTVVLTDENYQGNGYYLLEGDDLCDELDDQCFSDLDAIDLRVRALEVGDTGLDLSIHVGPSRFQLIAFELREDSLTVVIDLGQAASGIEFLATTFGEDVELPETLEGVIAGTITVDGPEAATLEYAVRQAVTVVATIPDMGGAISFSQAAKDPMFSLSADAIAETLAIAVDVGATTFSVPYSAVSDFSTNTDSLAVDIKGLSGSIALSEGDMELTIDDIAFGSGASTVKLAGETLFSWLHNDGLGPMSVTVAAVDPDAPIISFDPGLTLAIGTHFAPLVAEGEDIPAYFLDETYTIELTGGAPAVTGIPEDIDHDGALMITGGSLVLATDADAEATVTVADGDCLLPVEIPADGSHGILGELTSGTCP